MVSVVIAKAILRAAEEKGVEGRVLLEEVGLDPERMDDADGLMAMADEDALWGVAAKHFGPSFGLHAARSLGRGSFRALEYAVRTSRTFEDGLARLVRFDQLLHGMPLFVTHPASDGLLVVYDGPHDGHMSATVAGDFALATVVVIGRDAVGMPWTPSGVELAHPPPPESDRQAYAEIFGCAVCFDAPRYALTIPQDVLARPMREADTELNGLLTRMLEGQLPSRGVEGDLVAIVRRHIAMALPDGEPDLGAVASDMGIAGRTLQKRLQATGHRYKDLVAEVRVELAKRQLAEDGTTLAGVALAVGYSELSAFARAFKKWTGMTPGEFRRGARTAAGS
jgi:AraC-like DNA-binding protein